ncbi:hypothetical protein K438DRAFT_1801404 [Mycena galopus ATCC 62051]|nr:hypothetical protein K438DRAFT_1801404 [Mycena galopus ATCC 62051]
MDEGPHGPYVEPGFASETANNDHGSQCTGAFFAGAKHFVVAGGTFTNITHPPPSNFRRIPIIIVKRPMMGDLDLKHEILQNTGSRVARRRRGQSSVRRMYSVHLHGSNSAMTAVLYQGAHAEQQCRAEISRYSELRHPYLLQLYGIANTGGVHAAVFHDDLISHVAFWQQYTNSHFATLFFWACMVCQRCPIQISG